MRKGEKSKKMIKKYFIPIRGHKTVFAKSEKEAYKIVDKDLVDGFVVVTGKELVAVLDQSFKEIMESKKEEA